MTEMPSEVTYEDVRYSILRSDVFRSLGAQDVALLHMHTRWVSRIFSIRVVFGSGFTKRYWVKLQTDAFKEYDFLKQTHEQFVEYPGLDVVRPVVYLEDVDGVVTEHADGVILSGKIRRRRNRLISLVHRDRGLPEDLYNCGKWLSVLHSNRLSQEEAFPIKGVLRYIDTRLTRLVEAGTFESDFAQDVSNFMHAEASDVGADDMIRVRTHGDFCPYNVLISETGISVLDCDAGGYFEELQNYCPRYDDIVRFYGFAIKMSQAMISKTARKELAGDFLRGYNDYTDLEVSVSSPAFRIFQLKYRVLGVFDVSSTTSQLVGRRGRVAMFRRWFREFISPNA